MFLDLDDWLRRNKFSLGRRWSPIRNGLAVVGISVSCTTFVFRFRADGFYSESIEKIERFEIRRLHFDDR